MHELRASSLTKYACWYLRREARTKGDSRPIPEDPEQQVQVMWQRHAGKMRTWFTSSTRWHIVTLDTVSDIANLVFLESNWTKEEGLVVPGDPNYRLLGHVATNAIRSQYLSRPSAGKHREYDELSAGSLRLEGENRVAICSAEESEIRCNPDARYYLLDGVGRCLPYMIRVTERTQEFTPVEAFLAER